jgi:hypothetical protein
MNELDYTARAKQLWQELDERDRDGVRRGMWPLHKMHAAYAEGYKDRELFMALKKIASEYRDPRDVPFSLPAT